MQVLGIRSSPTTIRYAILDFSGESRKFVNESEENKLDFPPAFLRPEERINWFYLELDRILRQYPEIGRIVIKQQEYGKPLKIANSYVAYFDGIIFLLAAHRKIRIENKVYRSIGTKSKEVMEFAEKKVGRSKFYWDIQMADATAAAWSGRDDVL